MLRPVEFRSYRLIALVLIAVLTLSAAAVSSTSQSTRAYGPIYDITWASKGNMPTPWDEGGGVLLNDVIYAVGSHLNPAEVLRYDPLSDVWSSLAPLPTPRSFVGLVTSDDGLIYALGGTEGIGPGFSVLSTLEAYDPLTDTWTSRARMPTPRAGFGAARAANGKIYAFGGYPFIGAFTSVLDTVEEYDPVTDTWTSRQSMPAPRGSVRAVAANNGKIYVIGGVDSSNVTVPTVEEYDPATDTWTTRTPMSFDRFVLVAIAASNGRIYAMGGLSVVPACCTTLASVEEYDPATDTWLTKTSMPLPRSGAGAAVTSDDKIYVFGGGSDGVIGDAVFEGTITTDFVPDTTPPTTTISTPQDGATYVLGSVINANYGCQDESGGSGVASCTGTVPNGTPIDTSTIGSKMFMIDAEDVAGNITTITVTYSVIYAFVGFFESAEAGKNVRVSFAVQGASGQPVVAAGYPRSRPITCDSAQPLGSPTPTVSADPDGVVFHPGTGHYVYRWDTKKAWAGTCRQLVVTLVDGTTHTTNYRFTQ